METTDILLTAFGVALTFIGSLILHRLKAAEDRAKEDRARAAEDRAANKADHDRLFDAVSGLQFEVGDIKAVVSVLKDRSDRAERAGRDSAD